MPVKNDHGTVTFGGLFGRHRSQGTPQEGAQHRAFYRPEKTISAPGAPDPISQRLPANTLHTLARFFHGNTLP